MTITLQPTTEADFTFAHDAPYRLRSGQTLAPVTQHYAVYGDLDRHRDRVVLVCHALSGSARVADWWPQLFGPGLPLDLSRCAVVGVNVLGSCYGSTGPSSIDPHTGRPYGSTFPLVSIYDTVHAQARLMEHLGIDRLHAVVGGSIGGMQALAWATEYPNRVDRCLVVGAAPVGALALALGHLQRRSIQLDPAFHGGDYYETGSRPQHGLAIARGLAMCSYKSPELFDHRYGRKPDRNSPHPALHPEGRFDVAGYLDYQGRVFNDRFDANSYLAITRAMEAFDLGATAEEEAAALARITARVLMVGISSDWLFPPADVRSLAERMRHAGVDVTYRELVSAHGHDGFLAEAADLNPMLTPMLADEPALVAGG